MYEKIDNNFINFKLRKFFIEFDNIYIKGNSYLLNSWKRKRWYYEKFAYT